jgi:hypothetical protein
MAQFKAAHRFVQAHRITIHSQLKVMDERTSLDLATMSKLSTSRQ